MSWILINGYKIEVDGGIFVDGKRIDPKYDWATVVECCRKAKPKVPEHILRAEEDERKQNFDIDSKSVN